VPTYDSCLDDLNLLLSASIDEPDPNLDSDTPAETSSPSARSDQSVTGSVSDRGRPPRTSEVFQALGPVVVDVPSATTSRTVRSQSVLSSESPDAVARVELTPDRLAATGLSIEDPSNRSPFPWTHVLLLSYSSALTLALTWAIWNGWLQRPRVSHATNSSSSGVELATTHPETKPGGTIPPIPTENRATLGQTIRIGELEVTPLSVVMTPLTLVRSIEPSTERLAEGSSLVLRLRLTNVSTDHTFAPLEPGFLRNPISPLDRSFIETAKGDPISLFPLAIDSEWSILGQTFPELKPGESMETILASEPAAEDELSSEMIWRMRLRIGSSRTDLLGVRFTKLEVLSSSNSND
jgi:hypothetical protein